MSRTNDYYRILQVQPDAAAEVIRSSYRTLMQTLRIHPDLGGDHGRASLINEAYAVLSDPLKRQAYDASLESGEEETAAPPPESAATSPMDAPAAPGPDPGTHRGRPAPAAPASRCAFCGGAVSVLAARTGEGFWRCPTCRAPGTPPGDSAGEQGARDARAILRIEHDAPLRFLASWPQDVAHRGTVEDLSLIGMRFVGQVPLTPGQLLLLDCSVLDALGRVVEVKQRSDRFQVRVAFEGVALKQRQGGFVQTRA